MYDLLLFCEVYVGVFKDGNLGWIFSVKILKTKNHPNMNDCEK